MEENGETVVAVRLFQRFSDECRVSSVFHCLDERRCLSVPINARLFGFAVGGRVSHAGHISKRLFDRLFTVFAGHSLDSDSLCHIHTEIGKGTLCGFLLGIQCLAVRGSTVPKVCRGQQ